MFDRTSTGCPKSRDRTMLERDMEELIARYPEDFFPRKAWRLKDRQHSFAGVGRFDLLFEDEHRTNVLIELKARPAKYEDADQLAKYRTAIQETGTGNVIMWLVSPLIPKPIRDFLDSIGIDYTEIHEAEFRAIASKNSFPIQSETQSSPSLGRLTSWKGTSLHPNSNV